MIDCDVHQNVRSIAELLPYLPETHREHILHGGYAGIDLPEYDWTHPEGFWQRRIKGAPVCLGRVGGTTMPSAPGEYVFGRHGQILHCPWHGWEFDLESGEALFGHRVRLAPVQVEVENGTIVVSLERRSSR